MKTKVFCRKCGEQLLGDGGYCHVCRENKGDADVETRNFPEDPKNKVYLVDTYVTLCKCIRVEAKDGDEAVKKARSIVEGVMYDGSYREYGSRLDSAGFDDAEEIETLLAGETDKNGEEVLY